MNYHLQAFTWMNVRKITVFFKKQARSDCILHDNILKAPAWGKTKQYTVQLKYI